jgi:hypothetical protein
MYVTSLTRFKGGSTEEMVKAAKLAKKTFMEHGAEDFRLSRFHSGMWTGEWLVAIRFPNWSAYGNALDAVSKDAKYQKMFAQLLTVSQLTARSVVVGTDL